MIGDLFSILVVSSRQHQYQPGFRAQIKGNGLEGQDACASYCQRACVGDCEEPNFILARIGKAYPRLKILCVSLVPSYSMFRGKPMILSRGRLMH